MVALSEPASTGSEPMSDQRPTDLDHRLAQILDFLLLADRFKTIERGAYVGQGERRETDAEHTWHMALYALLLHEEIGFYVDIGHVLKLIVVHDLVEILAGDTYAYDDAALASQAEREARAAQELFGTLPDDLGRRLYDWWREFEAAETPEARFAKAIDRLQGFAQNCHSGGRAWRENGVSRDLTRRRTTLPKLTDPALAALIRELYARADRGGLWPEPPAAPERE